MEEFGMEELLNVKLGMVRTFLFLYRIKIWCFLGSTKYDVAPPTEEEKERIDEWHKFLTEDGDDQEEI